MPPSDYPTPTCRASVRELQRLQSKGASPIYAMFSETLDGIVTSRAYSRERQLEGLNLALLDTLIRPSYLNSCCGQWLNLRLVTMGALVSASTAALAATIARAPALPAPGVLRAPSGPLSASRAATTLSRGGPTPARAYRPRLATMPHARRRRSRPALPAALARKQGLRRRPAAAFAR